MQQCRSKNRCTLALRIHKPYLITAGRFRQSRCHSFEDPVSVLVFFEAHVVNDARFTTIKTWSWIHDMIQHEPTLFTHPVDVPSDSPQSGVRTGLPPSLRRLSISTHEKPDCHNGKGWYRWLCGCSRLRIQSRPNIPIHSEQFEGRQGQCHSIRILWTVSSINCNEFFRTDRVVEEGIIL